jgi:capsule polysaccharide export protein KpsE/RkpR
MAVGQAVLALAGPIGWGITAASTGISLLSLNSKNKELADDAVKEAKDIAKAREALDETTERINGLKSKTDTLYNDINRQKDKITGYMNVDYMSLKDFEKEFLGSLVNNTLSLSFLLNETIN